MPRINVTLEHIQRGGVTALRDVAGTSREPEYTDFPVYRMHWGWFPRPLPPIVAPLAAAAGLRAYDAYVQAHGRPDVIHAHNIFYGGHVAASIKAKRGVPVVLTEHSTSYMEGLVIFPGQTGIIQRTLAGVDAALAVGSALARAVRQFAPESRPDVIGNIVNTERFMLRDIPPVPPFIFCAIGTLEKRKDYPTMLAAFAQAFQEDDAQLWIAGEGAERAELEKIAADLSLSGQVTFLGRLDREGVRSLIARSHALVSSSLVESFGVTLIEAMACGLPVIATRSGGPDDFVDDANGILVPIRDISALADAMARLRTNYAAYDPARIRARCVERFSEEAIMSRLETIYAQVQRNG